MSTTSYNRLRAGIIQDTHTISAPVVPVAIDLANTPRRTGAGSAPVANMRTAPDLIGDGGGDVIKSAQASMQAKLNRKAQKQKEQQDRESFADRVHRYAFNEPDLQARDAQADPQRHARATLAAFSDLAEQTSAQGSQRHGVGFPSNSKYNGAGSAATSTADSRWANGPLGGFGQPAGSPFGVTPSTFDGVGGAFSGV